MDFPRKPSYPPPKMQSNRYLTSGHNATCVWCEHSYATSASRAHDNSIFCTKKCEIEAKFWLLDRLKEHAPNSEDSAGL